MSNEPAVVTLDQLRDALGVLGLDQELKNLRSVTIEPGIITVVRKRVNDEGHNFVVASNDVATETTQIRLAPPKAEAAQ